MGVADNEGFAVCTSSLDQQVVPWKMCQAVRQLSETTALKEELLEAQLELRTGESPQFVTLLICNMLRHGCMLHD